MVLDEGVQRRYTQAEEAMNKQDAWTADTNAKIILQKLGIPTLEKKIGELSGGQLKRVSLAQVLVKRLIYCYWMNQRTIWIMKRLNGWKTF